MVYCIPAKIIYVFFFFLFFFVFFCFFFFLFFVVVFFFVCFFCCFFFFCFLFFIFIIISVISTLPNKLKPYHPILHGTVFIPSIPINMAEQTV